MGGLVVGTITMEDIHSRREVTRTEAQAVRDMRALGLAQLHEDNNVGFPGLQYNQTPFSISFHATYSTLYTCAIDLLEGLLRLKQPFHHQRQS